MKIYRTSYKIGQRQMFIILDFLPETQSISLHEVVAKKKKRGFIMHSQLQHFQS